MISSLTQAERGAAMLITLAGMVAGLAMAAAGQGDPMGAHGWICLLYTSPSPRDATLSRMPSSA